MQFRTGHVGTQLPHAGHVLSASGTHHASVIWAAAVWNVLFVYNEVLLSSRFQRAYRS